MSRGVCWSVAPWALSLACSPAPPPPTSAPSPAPPATVAPAPTEPRPVPLAAPGASSDRGCEVAVRTRVVPLGEGRYELIARAANETDRQLETELHFDCPGTPARFDGLPPGYDLGNLCQAGACVAGPSVVQRLVLPPGASSEITRVTLDTRAGPCNAELPAGSYSIGASVRSPGLHSCTTSRAVFEHAARVASAPTSPRRPRPTPAPPREPPCPAMACAYTPCPPGVKPPEGCAGVCGCSGQRLQPIFAPALPHSP